MYLLDTDILIWVLRGNKKYQEYLHDLKDKGSISISTITIAEIYKNIYPVEIVKTEAVINELIVLNVTGAIAMQAGFYWQQYSKQLKSISLTDCLIAATANLHDLSLVTLNKKHFPMEDIDLADTP